MPFAIHTAIDSLNRSFFILSL